MDEAGEIDHARTTRSMIQQFHAEGKYWDVQLQINTELFKCQRLLLAANSEYFDTMFSSSNFEESDATRDQPIILHEMDAEAFKEILHFMYTGNICVKDDNIFQLLFMNDFLRLRTAHVKNKCIKHVKSRSREPRHEPISDALNLFSFACLKADDLVEILSAYVCEHLRHYSEDAKLTDLSFENLNALLESSKNHILLLPGSANILLKIIHNWVSYNREERSKYRSKLMKNINFSHVSPVFVSLFINRLESTADGVLNISRNIKSLSELKLLEMEMKINLTNGDAQFDGTISFNVKDLSKMPLYTKYSTTPKNIVFSSSQIISGLSWKTRVVRSNFNGLWVYLYCDGSPLASAWSCYASVRFTLVSHEEGKSNHIGKLERRLFSSSMNPCGFGFTLLNCWDDVIDPKNGYYNKNDDSIELRAHVYADIPFKKSTCLEYNVPNY